MVHAPTFDHKLVFAEGPGSDDALYVAVPYEDGHAYGSDAIGCFVSNDIAHEIEPGVTSMLQILTITNDHLAEENVILSDKYRSVMSEMAWVKSHNLQLKREIQISKELQLNNLIVLDYAMQQCYPFFQVPVHFSRNCTL